MSTDSLFKESHKYKQLDIIPVTFQVKKVQIDIIYTMTHFLFTRMCFKAFVVLKLL